VVGEPVLREPAGDVQPAQQRVAVLRLAAGLVERVAVGGDVGAVDGRVRGPVRAVVPEAVGVAVKST